MTKKGVNVRNLQSRLLLRVLLMAGAVLLCSFGLALGAGAEAPEPLFAIDFSGQPPGPAGDWLKEKGFKFRLDAGDLAPRFENDRLVLETSQRKGGLFELAVHIPRAKRIRIEWGVRRYPQGANWSLGKTAVAIAVMTSFGRKRISSGSLFVPNAPYFLGLFLGEKEVARKTYTGNYYQAGGRYYCMPCGVAAGESVVTELNLIQAFREEFGVVEVPPITRFGFQMNTKLASGGAEAFIMKVEYLAD